MRVARTASTRVFVDDDHDEPIHVDCDDNQGLEPDVAAEPTSARGHCRYLTDVSFLAILIGLGLCIFNLVFEPLCSWMIENELTVL